MSRAFSTGDHLVYIELFFFKGFFRAMNGSFNGLKGKWFSWATPL